jgi:hypothetical protein
MLTSGQLASLMELHPDLKSNADFAIAYLSQTSPGCRDRLPARPQAHAAHFRRCRDHRVKLPPALNSLKAHVLFHHLRIQAARQAPER